MLFKQWEMVLEHLTLVTLPLIQCDVWTKFEKYEVKAFVSYWLENEKVTDRPTYTKQYALSSSKVDIIKTVVNVIHQKYNILYLHK